MLFLFRIIGLTGGFPKALGISGPARSPLIGLAAGLAFFAWLIVPFLPRTAYVQCHPDYLLLRIGLMRLIVSYSRFRTSRSDLHG